MNHVVVLCGGRSAEHEISFLSAHSILTHLNSDKYRVSVLGIRKDGSLYAPAQLAERLRLQPEGRLHYPADSNWVCALSGMNPPADIVFPVLHGPFGEDGTVQGVLEVLDLPYVGAGVWGSAVGMNKIAGKRILRQAGLPVLPFLPLTLEQWERDPKGWMDRLEGELDYPLFVKPANLGSSIGINKSSGPEELGAHIEVAFRYDDRLLVEQGIEAREIELSVLGNRQPRVSAAGEIIPSREFYSYQAKYLDGESQLLIPAPLSAGQLAEVQELALAGFQLLQLEGMARMDFLLERASGRFFFNEPNTIPGFTEISMYPKLWEASGLAYPELLDRLLELGWERHRRRSRFSVEP